MVAVKREHLLDNTSGISPRVQHKLTMCLNPRRLVTDEATRTTGLCNDLLEHEPSFDLQVYNLINTFLNVLSKPVCVISYNGLSFDFPILKNHIEKLKVSLDDDLLCADCYHGFYHIETKKLMLSEQCSSNSDANTEKNNLSKVEEKPEETPPNTELKDDFNSTNQAMKRINETTPRHNKILPHKFVGKKTRRKLNFPWGDGPKPTKSYKLKDLYERILERPAADAHRAENDCIFALEISNKLAREFVEWIDENHTKWADVKPMRIGEPL